MSAFAVAAFHDPALPAGARAVEAVLWIRAAGLGPAGAEAALTLWTPAGAELTALREVTPATADRLAGCVRVDDHTLRFDAGCWSDGVYEFELAVALPARDPGDEMLAARVGVLAAGEQVAGALIAVTWQVAPGAQISAPFDAEVPGTAAVTHADLPTGASPEPRHTGAGEAGAAGPCRACGALPEDGDRFCEACGRELAAG